jgi:hypothetical protein
VHEYYDTLALMAQLGLLPDAAVGLKTDGDPTYAAVRRPAPFETAVLTPARLAGAAGRLLLGDRYPRRDVIAQTKQMMRLDAHRRRLNRRPGLEEQREQREAPAKALAPVGGPASDER